MWGGRANEHICLLSAVSITVDEIREHIYHISSHPNSDAVSLSIARKSLLHIDKATIPTPLQTATALKKHQTRGCLKSGTEHRM